jgi:hypothetical protein
MNRWVTSLLRTLGLATAGEIRHQQEQIDETRERLDQAEITLYAHDLELESLHDLMGTERDEPMGDRHPT